MDNIIPDSPERERALRKNWDAMLDETEEDITKRQREWERCFKTNMEQLLIHADVMRPSDMVRYAVELTDLVIKTIEERKCPALRS